MSHESTEPEAFRQALRVLCERQLQCLAPDVSPEEFWHIYALFGFNRPPPAGMNVLSHLGTQFDSVVARVRVEKAKAAATGHKLARERLLDDMWHLPSRVPPAP
jgi:hypothetical protein